MIAAKTRLLALSAIVLVGAGIAAFAYLRHGESELQFQGWVEAYFIFVSPDEDGRVETLAVREGDAVTEGALLFALDADLQRAAVAEAEAAVANAKITFARAQELLIFPRRRRARVEAVAREITHKVSAWLGGQLLLAAIIGSTAAIGLGLLGVPYFYVLAVIAAVGEVIPVVGPILAAVPGIAVALGESGTLALWVGLFYLAQQQLENHVLVPKLMERQVGVSAVTVIVALLIGSAVLGVVGALLAVPTAAIVQVLFQHVVLGDEGEDGPASPG